MEHLNHEIFPLQHRIESCRPFIEKISFNGGLGNFDFEDFYCLDRKAITDAELP